MSKRLIAAVAALMFLSAFSFMPVVRAQKAADAPGGQVTVITGADGGMVRIRSTRFR
ncbi:MAG: hypothetical protein LC754_12090 [Acidobacteria bacterium]|nr:hypothetical protein [Acidobacteriota bacterium]